ncbi:MAG: sugar phosphate isomerase/epimerase [Anaerolineae bacterium]|nr:sugar phosphate isomerase/epimerase [Anaerolineae bacterium]
MIVLSTGSVYTYGLGRVIDLAARAGYDGVEVLVDDRWDTRQPRYLKRLARDAGLPIVAVHNPFVPHVEGWPANPVERLLQSVDLAQDLGARVVVAHPPRKRRGVRVQSYGGQFHQLEFVCPLLGCGRESRQYVDFLQTRLAELEATSGVQVGVENMPAKSFLGRPFDRFWLNKAESLAALSHVTLDTTHVGTWGLDLLEYAGVVRSKMIHVHLSDFDGREHRLPGEGHLALPELLRTLARSGYAGAISVEVSPGAFDISNEDTCLQGLCQALVYCREYFRIGIPI